MADTAQRKTAFGIKMTVMGILSFVLYMILLLHQEMITGVFARGEEYALLPIVTAFIFSFVHGSFTGNFWSFLGMHPKQKREGQ
ncbi:MAG TPA: hypothetical protein VK445_12410 [Dissulfurispiraceae bacterium]|nr:hypothetical protein [Dissulfurispiraceae bacterium]